MDVRRSVGFGSIDSDFQIFGIMLISPIRGLLIIGSDSVWFLPDLGRIRLISEIVPKYIFKPQN